MFSHSNTLDLFIWEAVFADMGVALIAIANATRVLRS